MAQTERHGPWVRLTLLLVVGGITAIAGLWLGWHPAALPSSGALIAILLATYFVCFTWAVLAYLRWRGHPSAVRPVRPTSREECEGTIYGLVAGGEYQVMRSFVDSYGSQFQRGEILHYRQRHFLPYADGHTVIFDERTVYLQEDRNREVLGNFSTFIAPIQR